MIELILAAALAQGQMAPAPEPAWRHVARNDEGEAWVDPGSLRRTGDTFEIVWRAVFYEAKANGMLSGITRSWFDCTHRLVAMRHYTSFDARGAVLGDRDAYGAPSQPHPISDGSVYAGILRLYCPPPTPAR